MNPTFLPKEHPDLPDHYGMTVFYVTGKKEEFELASHVLNQEAGFVEFVTRDNLWNWIPLSSILRLEFDKKLSRIVQLKAEKERKKELI